MRCLEYWMEDRRSIKGKIGMVVLGLLLLLLRVVSIPEYHWVKDIGLENTDCADDDDDGVLGGGLEGLGRFNGFSIPTTRECLLDLGWFGRLSSVHSTDGWTNAKRKSRLETHSQS